MLGVRQVLVAVGEGETARLADEMHRFDRGRRQRGEIEALEEFEALQALGRDGARADWLARGLEHRGRIAWYRGHLDEAQTLFRQALSELPEPVGRIAADLHNDLGIVFYYRGDADTAFDYHRRGLRLREEMSDRLGLAKSLINIGNVLFDLRDDLKGARDHYERALTHARSVGDRLMTFSVIKNLGGVATEAGDWRGALALFDEASRLQEDMGWSFGAYVTLQNRVVCEIALGRIGDALRHLDETSTIGPGSR